MDESLSYYSRVFKIERTLYRPEISSELNSLLMKAYYKNCMLQSSQGSNSLETIMDAQINKTISTFFVNGNAGPRKFMYLSNITLLTFFLSTNQTEMMYATGRLNMKFASYCQLYDSNGNLIAGESFNITMITDFKLRLADNYLSFSGVEYVYRYSPSSFIVDLELETVGEGKNSIAGTVLSSYNRKERRGGFLN